MLWLGPAPIAGERAGAGAVDALAPAETSTPADGTSNDHPSCATTASGFVAKSAAVRTNGRVPAVGVAALITRWTEVRNGRLAGYTSVHLVPVTYYRAKKERVLAHCNHALYSYRYLH
jgi:hypothetical protein